MRFFILWSARLLSSNKTASICCKPDCTPVSVVPAGALASLPGNKDPGGLPCYSGEKHLWKHLCSKANSALGSLQLCNPPVCLPLRKKSPRWAWKSTTDLAVCSSGCQHVVGLSGSKNVCMQKAEPSQEMLFQHQGEPRITTWLWSWCQPPRLQNSVPGCISKQNGKSLGSQRGCALAIQYLTLPLVFAQVLAPDRECLQEGEMWEKEEDCSTSS